MIGDNLKLDVMVPTDLGMHAIWITKGEEQFSNVITVKNILDLKKYL